MNEEETLKSGIEEMKKANKQADDILAPFYEMFDENFKQMFGEFAEKVLCLGLDCLAEETILFNLSKNIRKHIETESIIVRLEQDIGVLKQNLDEINDEKSKLDRMFDEKIANKNVLVDDIHRKLKDKNFFHQKSLQYMSTVENMETILTKNIGLVDDLRVENITKKQKTIEELQKNLNKLQNRLSAYRNLPADVDLAKVKIEEKRSELEKLEKALNDLVESYDFRD